MSKRNIFWLAIPGLATFLGAPARAQNNSVDYTFLVASGFLCDFAACPAVVRSANADNYEMSGAGTFNTQSKSVTAAGTFAHKSSNGTVLEAGVWIISELVRFDSYGIAPDALMHEARALGPVPLGPKHLPMSFGPAPTGGLAVFRIRLLPMRGATKTAILQVNCALGDVPRERPVEGVRLSFESKGGEFFEEVTGRVMFLAMRPEPSTPAKAPQQETTPEATEPPHD